MAPPKIPEDSKLPRRRALLELAAWSTVPFAGAAAFGCESGRLGGAAAPARARGGAVPPPAAVRRIFAEPTTDGKGARLHRIFPTPQLANLDPFVLLDDFDVAPPAGFPTHPHRGFEAFTYMIDGAFHHVDNLGNDGVITAGGTQRFTSGRGAWHSEMPGTDGENRGLQLWVNLPRRLKQMTPNYAGLDASRHAVSEVTGANVRTVVGRGSDVELQTAVRYQDVNLAAGSTFHGLVEEGWNAILYVVEGTVNVASTVLERYEGILPTAGVVAVLAQSPSRFVLLSGKPHYEPIIHHGPFVD